MSTEPDGWHPEPDDPEQPDHRDGTHPSGHNVDHGPALALWASALASLHNSTDVGANPPPKSRRALVDAGPGRRIGATSTSGTWFTRHKVTSSVLGLLATFAVIGLVAPAASQPEAPASAAASPTGAPDDAEPARVDPRVAAFLGAGLDEPDPAELRSLEEQCTGIGSNDASALRAITDLPPADRTTLQSKLEIVCPDAADMLTAALADHDVQRVSVTAGQPGDTVDSGEDVASTPSTTSAGDSGTVTRIIDGDTVEIAGYGTVRVVGIDTPEQGECGYDKASQVMSDLVLGKTVTLVPGARDDRDHYGRLLRYLDVGPTDAGLELIHRGLATARYDSRDGYGAHPREQQYVAADSASADTTQDFCPAPPPATSSGSQPSGGAEPWNGPGPDLDCADIGHSVAITGPDYHRLDRDGDGIGCESYG